MPEEWTEEQKAEALAEYDEWLDAVRLARWQEEQEEQDAMHLAGDL